MILSILILSNNNQYDLSRDILAYCSYLAKHHIIPLKMCYCTLNSQQDCSKSVFGLFFKKDFEKRHTLALFNISLTIAKLSLNFNFNLVGS